jgi:dTDP-4-amino-4,6-dideoxygalactose transaminase
MINVTKTFLPPIQNYIKLLDKIWDNTWLTNRGPFVINLENILKNELKVKNIILMNNGTIPLQIAIKSLVSPGDEVITTPFSYVATVSSIIWEGAMPVFVDIDPTYLSIDENLIEKKITKKTKAILATHVFGNPCNIKIIEKIAKKYNLFVIYDAAHCFGVKYLGKSIFSYGDISTCSFHATKIFHTAEGGAFFCKNNNLFKKAFYQHNFGHKGKDDFYGLGINGKMSELNAAMGLSILPFFSQILESRKNSVKFYLQNLNWVLLSKMELRDNVDWNYSYFPIIFKSEKILLKVIYKLNSCQIYPRRYFYPSLNNLKFTKGDKMIVSESISKRIICLPLYNKMKINDLKLICKIINNILNE